jgi:hypothetical protein
MKRYFLFIVFCLFAGCQSSLTIKPKPVVSAVIAYEGTEQNNGIVSQDPTGLVITPAKRDYFNALIEIYGDAKWRDTGLPCFVPAVKKDFGITPQGENYHVDNGAIQNVYVLMVQWYKSGRAPK